MEIRTGDGETISVPRSQRRGILAYLLVNAGRLITAERLAVAVWGPAAPVSGRSQIHAAISTLRRYLRDAGAAATVTGVAGGYRLDLGGDEVDLVVFEDLVAEAKRDTLAGRWARAVPQLRAALGLWRGEAFADASGEFVEERRRSLHDRRLGTVEMLLRCRLELGEHAEVLGELRELAAAHPLHEGFRGQLMLALYRGGQREEALQQFQQLRVALADEQGLDPGTALVALQLSILSGEELDPGVPNKEVGWRPPVPAQLPPQPAGFVGRERELGAMGGAGVTVIVGGAGVGKTAIAVRWAARRLEDSPDGQLFVDLHGFGGRPLTPHEALERLLRGLGVPAADLPRDLDERGALYRSLTAGRRCLVVLDNARDSEQVRPLVAAGGTTVVTSRRRLDGLVVHEDAQVITVGPLPEGDGRALLGALTGYDSDDPAVTRLAALCDQLPLALRIAAARLRGGGPGAAGELADALTDEQQRLQGLAVEEGSVAVRAAFGLTYRALSAPAARLFRLLGVFPARSRRPAPPRPSPAGPRPVRSANLSPPIWCRTPVST